MSLLKSFYLILFGIFLFNINVYASSTPNTLNTGDIAFTAFNGDGNDDFAFVTFVDIPSNTLIRFCDSELNGLGQFGTDENDFTWESGSTVIPAGTVITVHNISSTPNPNIGIITGTTGLTASGEALFAYIGSAPRVITKFLAAIGTGSNTFGNLDNSGLTLGSTAINLPTNIDIAEYIGTRTGLNVNSYISSLNNMSNWAIQDNSTDDHNDGINPDVPFNSTMFLISNTDLLPPNVVSVTITNQNSINVLFSEAVNFTQAETISNYSISPSLTINSIIYNSSTFTATLNTSNLNIGTFYTLTIQNIEDIANNSMSLSTNPNLVFNNTTPNLVFSEIMYNPHSNGDDYEFIEIYNAGSTTAILGGLKVKDESNFNFTLPEMTLAAGSTLLLATNAQVASTFYNRTFLDLPGSGNFLGNGGETLQILNSTNQVLLSVFYDDASPWPTSPDGTGPSLELKNPSTDNNNGENWKAATNNLGSNGIATLYGTPGTFTPEVTIIPNIAFSAVNYVVNENSGSVNVVVNLSAATSQTVLCSLKVINNFGTANNGNDYTFNNQLLTFAPNTTTQTINIPIIDNMNFNPSKLFMLELSNNTNSNLGTNFRTTVYIKENENGAPIAQNTLGMTHVTSFKASASGTAEIVSFDKDSKRLFVLNATESRVEIYDLHNPANPLFIKNIDMTQYGPDATSVAVKNGIVAATVDPGTFGNGIVVFFDINGENERIVEVGNLPDMITFSPDGHYAMTANEGQPNPSYTIDPEGSVSLIDISGGLNSIDQSKVTTMTFNAFDNQRQELINSGIRIFGLNNPSVSQDFEPEYITISDDSQTAWVSIQENNAIAKIDLVNLEITDVFPLGYKDHSLPQNTLDASDQFGTNIFMAQWPIKGVYMPDAIAHFNINGYPFIISANEGDAREYDAYQEILRVNSANYTLDPLSFPNASFLKLNTNIGRLNATTASGDIDGDGDFDEIHILGARSFSIWNGNTGQQIYDSGNQLELITAEDPTYRGLFNASNSNNTFKNRSDDKGPEPEGVTTAKIEENTYAFIALERTGGVITYNVTNPANPVFENYINTRNLSAFGGDNGAEGIIYISPLESPDGYGYVLTANEISGTVAVFRLNNVFISLPEVVTNETIENVTNNSADVSANLISNGNSQLTNLGFIYSTNPEPTLVNSELVNVEVITEGEYNSTLNNLSSATTYYFRAIAQNELGTTYGDIYSFTTLAPEPTRQARSLTFYKIGKNVLGLRWTNGNGQKRIMLASNSMLNQTNYLLDGKSYTAGTYGSNSSEINDAYVVYNGIANTFDVTNLTNNTTYYFRVFEYNGNDLTTNYLLTTATNNPSTRKTLKKENEDYLVEDLTLNIYPNPASNNINIDLNYNIEDMKITIVDAEGNEIFKQNNYNKSLNLDINNFANGVYYVLITNDNEAIFKSFVIER